ncbi:unnamed protein product [Ectocarpus sp. 4 AP-2014]
MGRNNRRSHGRKKVAAPAKLGKRHIDTRGILYWALPNIGRGMCGLIALIQAEMVAEGVPLDEVLRRTTGELDAEMKARVQHLRMIIVAAAHERVGIELDEDPAADGGKTVEDLLKDGDIKSCDMFRKVMSRPDAYLDQLGMSIGAAKLKLEGMQLVGTIGAKKTGRAKRMNRSVCAMFHLPALRRNILS